MFNCRDYTSGRRQESSLFTPRLRLIHRSSIRIYCGASRTPFPSGRHQHQHQPDFRSGKKTRTSSRTLSVSFAQQIVISCISCPPPPQEYYGTAVARRSTYIYRRQQGQRAGQKEVSHDWLCGVCAAAGTGVTVTAEIARLSTYIQLVCSREKTRFGCLMPVRLLCSERRLGRIDHPSRQTGVQSRKGQPAGRRRGWLPMQNKHGARRHELPRLLQSSYFPREPDGCCAWQSPPPAVPLLQRLGRFRCTGSTTGFMYLYLTRPTSHAPVFYPAPYIQKNALQSVNFV